VYELLSCRFGRFRLHTSLRLRALIRSWQGVYVCKFRSTRTRFQFKKTLPGEHSSEHFCCLRTHFQAFMNLAEMFFLRWFSEVRKKLSWLIIPFPFVISRVSETDCRKI